MKRILAVGLIVSTVALIAVGVITLYDYNLSIGRMWQTPAIKPHEKPIPVMVAGSVPVTGGEALFRTAVAETITPTFLLTEPAAIAAGKTAYQRYCIQCHGQKFDGYGTVGQSLPRRPETFAAPKSRSMHQACFSKRSVTASPTGASRPWPPP
jgi:cytochrome c1